jgi:hypothetical protein
MTRPAALATRPRPKVPRGKPVRWQPARIKHGKKAAPLNMAASLQHPVYWLSVPRESLLPDCDQDRHGPVCSWGGTQA